MDDVLRLAHGDDSDNSDVEDDMEFLKGHAERHRRGSVLPGAKKLFVGRNALGRTSSISLSTDRFDPGDMEKLGRDGCMEKWNFGRLECTEPLAKVVSLITARNKVSSGGGGGEEGGIRRR